MRAFVGLPVPEAWRAPLIRAQARIPGGRAVPEDDLHLTLVFLDDQPEARLEALHEALEGRRLGAAPLRPLAWAAFEAGRATLVALDLTPDPELSALRDGMRRAARAAAIELPRDRFRPHVTLVRFPASAPPDPARLPGAVASLGAADMGPETARLAILWASTLTPAGPVYETLASYPLLAA